MNKVYPSPLPVIHAILICDKIITEDETHKKTLLGIFDSFYYTKLPIRAPELWVYVNLSDVTRKHDIKLDLVYLDDNKMIVQLEDKIPPSDGSGVELGFCFKDIRFDRAGVYAFRFWADNNVIGDKYIYVRRHK